MRSGHLHRTKKARSNPGASNGGCASSARRRPRVQSAGGRGISRDQAGSVHGTRRKGTFLLIPVNEPHLGEREFELVAECVRTGWVSSSGKFITEFEDRWAAYCGRQHGVALSNGTVALQLAVAVLDLKP